MHSNAIPYNPAASVADFALAQAAGGRSAQLKTNGFFPTADTPVAPANLAAPAAAVIAVFALIGKVTGRFKFGFNLDYTLSATGTCTASISRFTGVTNVAGGTTTGNFTWESSAITVTGGAAAGIPATYSAQLAAGGLVATANLSGVAIVPAIVTPIWLVFALSSAVNLSAMTLNAYAYEF